MLVACDWLLVLIKHDIKAGKIKKIEEDLQCSAYISGFCLDALQPVVCGAQRTILLTPFNLRHAIIVTN